MTPPTHPDLAEFVSWNKRAVDVGLESLFKGPDLPAWFVNGGPEKWKRMEAVKQAEQKLAEKMRIQEEEDAMFAAFRDYSERCKAVDLWYKPLDQIKGFKDVPTWFLKDCSIKESNLKLLEDREMKATVLADYKAWADRAAAVRIDVRYSHNVKDYGDVPGWFKSGSSEKASKLDAIMKAEQEAAEVKRIHSIEAAMVADYKNWAQRAAAVGSSIKFVSNVSKYSDIPGWFRNGSPDRKSNLLAIVVAEQKAAEKKRLQDAQDNMFAEYKDWAERAAADGINIKPLDITPLDKICCFCDLPDWFIFGGAMKDSKLQAIVDAEELLARPQK